MEKEADSISNEDLHSLVDELVASTPEGLIFLHEGYSQSTGKEVSPPVELKEAEVSGKVLENRALLLDAIGSVLREKKTTMQKHASITAKL